MSRRLKPRGISISFCEKELCQLDKELEEVGKLSWFFEINTSVGLKTLISLEFLHSRVLPLCYCVCCWQFVYKKSYQSYHTSMNKSKTISVFQVLKVGLRFLYKTGICN